MTFCVIWLREERGRKIGGPECFFLRTTKMQSPQIREKYGEKMGTPK